MAVCERGSRWWRAERSRRRRSCRRFSLLGWGRRGSGVRLACEREPGGGGRVRVGGRVGWRAKGDGKGTYPFRRPGPGSRARRASRGAAECTIEPLGRRGIDWATGVAMGRRCMRRRKVTEWAKFEVFPSRTSTAVKKMMHGERESGLYTLPFPSLRPLRPKPHTTTPASKRLRETSLPWPLKT